MKKVVLKVEFHDDKARKKAMTTVSSILGVESISMEKENKKLTVIGDIDPVQVVSKLRKLCHTDLISVGPAKEEKKDDKPKKEEKDKDKENKDPNKDVSELVELYKKYNPYMTTHYYVTSAEENPNSCVIC